MMRDRKNESVTGLEDWFCRLLPLFTQFRWRIIVPRMPGFLLGGFHPLAAAGPDKYTVQRSRMSAAALFLSQLAVQLANADMGITAMAVADPTQFFFRVGIGMLAVGAVRPGR